MELELGLSLASILFLLFLGVGGWVGVEIEVNANSAPNWVGVEALAELDKNVYNPWILDVTKKFA